ncbi:orotate phosphoribosyltransferase [Paenibacillus arenilitoris]|uniref:Orotate phosphoribosyltransferase n=1 Tax=Paenibacillus arenilitoris TaxID=2772299 RepID=A0A927H5V8_9BACL|nr:orotate phosphoribosyltransferase [Paenibacillus arenilitoris]MBD2869345.1 orotate phosphoribosyltransferase [Paenibacillus arenilitoris]
MEKETLARAICEAAYLQGEFKLRSGQTSDRYFDKYLFESDPALLGAIAEHLAPLVPKGTEALAGLEMGGIPVATALSLATGIPVAFVRKKAKDYGTRKLAEGIGLTGRKVCVIEDVVTTGGQILQSAADLREEGACVDAVLSVIERDANGRRNLEAAGLTYYSLFEMNDLLPNYKKN